jgi:hypothetical protein
MPELLGVFFVSNQATPITPVMAPSHERSVFRASQAFEVSRELITTHQRFASLKYFQLNTSLTFSELLGQLY